MYGNRQKIEILLSNFPKSWIFTLWNAHVSSIHNNKNQKNLRWSIFKDFSNCVFSYWSCALAGYDRSVRDQKLNRHKAGWIFGWSVLAFLGLVISLICLLLGRIYRPFLINTLCNLFYDFAACIRYAICLLRLGMCRLGYAMLVIRYLFTPNTH